MFYRPDTLNQRLSLFLHMEKTILYIDPGTGSYIVQIIIAAVLGVIFYFKTAWKRIKSFFSGKDNDSSKNT